MIKFFIASLLLCSSALAGLPPTSSKISGDSANVTTFNYQFPNLTGTHTGTTVNIPTYSVPAPGSTGSILTSISSAWTSFLVDPITTTIYVDGNRVDSYTPDGTQFFPYKTIQTGINAAVALASGNNVTVTVAPKRYAENITVNQAITSLAIVCPIGECWVGLNNGSPALDSSSNNNAMVYFTFTNFTLNGAINFVPSANTPTTCISGCSFSNISVLNGTDVTFKNLWTLSIDGAYWEAALNLENITGATLSRIAPNSGTLALVTNLAHNAPSGFAQTFIFVEDSRYQASSITVDAGSYLQVNRGTRLGSNGSTFTINGTVDIYNSEIRSDFTVNSGGTLSLYGSSWRGTKTVNPGGTFNNNDTADKVAYTPTTSADWNSVPTEVKTALDSLASTGIYKSQTQNKVFASPNGSSGLPTFRALVAGDLPAGTGTVTSVAMTVPTFLSVAGSPITTSGTLAVTLSGTALPAANGGTGLTSITAHDLIIGNGTSAATLLAPSATSGIPLVSQGASADPAYSTAVVAGGGTGLTTLTAHNVLLGEGTSNVAFAAPGTTGIPLISQGAASDPAFGTVTLAGGGLGITSGTSGGIPYFSSSSTVASSASLTSGAVILGGGAGSAPTSLSGTNTNDVLTWNGSAWVSQGSGTTASNSESYYDTGNGHGSTNTKIRRFTNARSNTGTCITYTGSSTNGDKWVLNCAGMYLAEYCDAKSTSSTVVTVTQNDSALTTNASTPLTYAQGNRSGVYNDSTSVRCVTVAISGAVNDIIRAHDDGTNDDTTANSMFHILLAGGVNANVTSNASGAEHIERATIANNGSCSITSQSGSWISSVSHNSGGCTLNFTGGEFSSAPSCSGTTEQNYAVSFGVAPTTSSVDIRTTLTTNASLTDKNFEIICMGAR